MLGARTIRRRVYLTAVVWAMAIGTAAAQDSRGAITGTLRDASQAVVPGAIVTVTNLEMGTAINTTSNEVGFFQVPYLIAGPYRVTVTQPGFKTYTSTKLDIHIADRLELNLTLEVGEAMEDVMVSASTPLLELSLIHI